MTFEEWWESYTKAYREKHEDYLWMPMFPAIAAKAAWQAAMDRAAGIERERIAQFVAENFGRDRSEGEEMAQKIRGE